MIKLKIMSEKNSKNPAVDKEKNLKRSDDGPNLDPWSSKLVGEDDYDRLSKDFGIESLDTLDIPYSMYEKNRYLRRKIIFGHIDLKPVLQAAQFNKPWAVMSGIKPSGQFHLGTLTTASEIVEFQKMGGKVYYAIADMESYFDNGMPYKQSYKYAVQNLADILTIGLNPDKAYVWLQSREPIANQMPYNAGKYVTANQMKAIYGDKPFALYLAALIQTGDILLPQLKDEIMPTVVPVGIDQAPHLRLVRDLTRHFTQNKEKKEKNGKVIIEEHPLFKPASTYHKLMPALDNIAEKMSKSNPNSYFNMGDEDKSIKKKIMGAFTGGRRNKEEQQKLGGQPDRCMIFRMMEYHFQPDDTVLFDRRTRCLGGMLCGTCKKECYKIIQEYVVAHNKNKKEMIPIAEEILSRTPE